VDEVARAPIRRDPDADWFSALGRVASRWILLLAGVAALLPGLVHGWGRGGRRLVARAALSAVFAVLVWEDPLPALWILGLPVLVTGLSPRRPAWGLALLPAAGLVAIGAVAWARGFAHGTWLPLWYRGALVVALLLSAVPAVSAAPGRSVRNGARVGGRSARRGLSRVRAAS
jgi:hypothetical protein